MTTKSGLVSSIAASTWGSAVSACSHNSGRTASSRSARKRTCWALSSAVTYRARPGQAANSCNSSVLLPIPGSPPSNVTEPGTTPPPSTRSSSLSPVVTGRLTSGSMSAIEQAGAAAGPMIGTSARATSSTSVFHCPHELHWPAHLGCAVPQSVQTCSILVFAMMPIMTEGVTGGVTGDGELWLWASCICEMLARCPQSFVSARISLPSGGHGNEPIQRPHGHCCWRWR